MTMPDRPLLRRAVLGAAAVLLLALIAVPAARMHGCTNALTATGATPEDVLKGLERPEIPETENAARWLQAGAGAIVWSDEDQSAIGIPTQLPYKEWNEEQRAQVRALLELHQGALATLHKAAWLEGSDYGLHYQDGFGMEVPKLLDLMRAARLLLCEARVSFGDGDVQQGLLAVATVSRTASSLYEESTLITTLIAIAVERMALVAALEVTGSDADWIDAELLDKLQATIPTASNREVIERVATAWEAVVLDALNQGKRTWDVGTEEPLEIPADLEASQVHEAVALVKELLNLTYGTAEERFAPLLKVENKEDLIAADLKGFANTIGRGQSVAAQRQLLRAAIAMRKLGLEQGSYPATRPAVPELLEPDPFTGKQILYAVGRDGSLSLELDGAWELLEPIVVSGIKGTFVPVTLPAP